MDLLRHLRETLHTYFPPTEDGQADVEEGDVKKNEDWLMTMNPLDISVTQSILLCMDTLGMKLGRFDVWQRELAELLQDTVGYAIRVCVWCQERLNGRREGSDVQRELVKVFELLGSLFLCSGSICATIKVRALPVLAVRIFKLCAHFIYV